VAGTKVSERHSADNAWTAIRSMPAARWVPEVLAGITLLAIAIPEQLATAQLAEVSSFLAILAFVFASIVFAIAGSNPILSVGADSTIAPLFAVALTRLAVGNSPDYLVTVAATSVLAGLILLLVGLFKLGWIADFLSQPIVAGFMGGIGLTIIVHQLPDALGLAKVSGTFIHRVHDIVSQFPHLNGWCVGITLSTLVILIVGERVNARIPFALMAVIAATVVTRAAGLASHGVTVLGAVHVLGPSFRLTDLHSSQLATIATTGLVVAIVILSQTAATSRGVADELGIDVSINRDFVGVGLACIATGLAGTIPVNASPARTGVVRFAGGRTQVVGLVAGLGALVVIPLAPELRDLPLAVLAGVLIFVAGRLIKVPTLRKIARVDRYELGLALITGLAVILIGVQEGLAVAVGLAILDQTRRSARPHVVVLGRRPGTTSWERVGAENAETVPRCTVLLFGAALYFVNAAVFRAQVHTALKDYPETTYVVIDAAPVADIDYTGLSAFADLVEDLDRDHITVVLARANDSIIAAMHRAPSALLSSISTYSTVDEAVTAFVAADAGS
jgi:MFS superfamily sulfate permease-like transporter